MDYSLCSVYFIKAFSHPTNHPLYFTLPVMCPLRLHVDWQESYHTATRLKFFKNCPFFDFCTPEVLRNLCFQLKQQIYNEGDCVIAFGDLGQEMFFVQDGSVEVGFVWSLVIYIYIFMIL